MQITDFRGDKPLAGTLSYEMRQRLGRRDALPLDCPERFVLYVPLSL